MLPEYWGAQGRWKESSIVMTGRTAKWFDAGGCRLPRGPLRQIGNLPHSGRLIFNAKVIKHQVKPDIDPQMSQIYTDSSKAVA